MDTQRQNVVGLQIQAVRKEQRMTQEVLSQHLQRRGVDIDRKAFSKIETGLRRVTDAELYAIADILEVSTDMLYPSRASMLKFLENLTPGE